MIVFCVILTLVCSLRACHMWLTRNHMFIREIWGNFTSFIFWNFEISLVSLGRFQNFKKVNLVNLSQISLLNIWLLVQIQLLFTEISKEKPDISCFYDWKKVLNVWQDPAIASTKVILTVSLQKWLCKTVFSHSSWACNFGVIYLDGW